jgi:hypothetical protein
MIVGFRQHARDHAPLLGHPHSLRATERLDVSPVGDIFVRRGHDAVPVRFVLLLL